MAIIKQNDAFKKKSGIKKLPINNSSFISAFQFDADNSQLVVVLKSGGEYIYNDVDAAVFDALVVAPSKGLFYSKYIKGKFQSTRLIDKTVGPEEGKHGNARVERYGNRTGKDGGASSARKPTRGGDVH